MHRNRLAAIAGFLNTHGPARRLAFLAAALLSMLLIGYHFATFDQVVHIPFLKADADPSLYPGDAFIALRHNRYSYFWLFFQPAYRLGLLEASLFAAHLLATYLTFWAAWKLSLTLFDDSLAALLSVAALIFPHIGFLGFPIIEFSLLNRTFVLPFLLLAVDLHLRRRYRAAFLLLGLAANLHALTAGLAAAMLIFAQLVQARRAGWRSLAQGSVFFLIGAAPLLWLPGEAGQRLDFSLRPEWLAIVARGILAQVFYPFAPIPHIAALTLGGFSALGLLWIAQRAAPATPGRSSVRAMLAAAGLIMALGVVTAQFLPVTLLIELQLNRVSLYLLIFAYLYFANWLAQAYRAGRLPPAGMAWLAGTFITSTSPALPLAVWGWLAWAKPQRLAWSTAVVGIAFSLSVSGLSAAALGLWQPGIHIFTRPSDWVDVQDWARQDTPRDALFITPPEKGSVYEPDWRVVSERSTAVQLIDLLEVALAPQHLPDWQQRFERIAPGALEQFRGNYFESREITRQAFYALDDEQIAGLACDLGADYLVVEKAQARPLPVAYENAGYVVHRLPGEEGGMCGERR